MQINPAQEVVKPRKQFGVNHKKRGVKTSATNSTEPSMPVVKSTLGSTEKIERAAHRKKVLANKFEKAER
jgi:hypothetical protein